MNIGELHVLPKVFQDLCCLLCRRKEGRNKAEMLVNLCQCVFMRTRLIRLHKSRLHFSGIIGRWLPFLVTKRNCERFSMYPRLACSGTIFIDEVHANLLPTLSSVLNIIT